MAVLRTEEEGKPGCADRRVCEAKKEVSATPVKGRTVVASDGIGDKPVRLMAWIVSDKEVVMEKTCVGGGATALGILGASPKNSEGDLNLNAPGIVEEIDGASSYLRD